MNEKGEQYGPLEHEAQNNIMNNLKGRCKINKNEIKNNRVWFCNISDQNSYRSFYRISVTKEAKYINL